MPYNARSHTARVYMTFLHDKGISVMNWLAMFPDLNPIEHTWNIISRRIIAATLSKECTDPYRSPGSEIADDSAKGHQEYATSMSGVCGRYGRPYKLLVK